MNAQRGNGQAQACRALEDAIVRQNALLSCVECLDEGFSFCRDPAQYEWRYIGKRAMLVPYNNGLQHSAAPKNVQHPPLLSGKSIRWEKHQVWIVEGVLVRGESNVLQRRRFYIDEDSWMVLLGDGHDLSGELVMHYLLESHSVASGYASGRWHNV
jgi:hypothetical protein